MCFERGDKWHSFYGLYTLPFLSINLIQTSSIKVRNKTALWTTQAGIISATPFPSTSIRCTAECRQQRHLGSEFANRAAMILQKHNYFISHSLKTTEIGCDYAMHRPNSLSAATGVQHTRNHLHPYNLTLFVARLFPVANGTVSVKKQWSNHGFRDRAGCCSGIWTLLGRQQPSGQYIY